MRGEIPDFRSLVREAPVISFSADARDVIAVLGLVLQHLGALPSVADKLEYHRWQFEIVDMDGRRIDKVLTTKAPHAVQ
jgi:CBS domain containing-hemolysin-like protein